MFNLKHALSLYKEKTGKTNNEIASDLGVRAPTVSRWATGAVKKVTPDFQETLYEYLGEDIVQKATSDDMKPDGFYKTLKSSRTDSEDSDGEAREYIEVTRHDNSIGDFFVWVDDDSMEADGLCIGDLVYFKQTSHTPDGRLCAIQIGSAKNPLIRRVYDTGTYLVLQASDPRVAPMVFTRHEVESLPVNIIGKIVYIRKDASTL